MLCLSGRIGERFVIGGQHPTLTVTLLERRGKEIRVGFEGTEAVDRETVWLDKYADKPGEDQPCDD